MPLFISFSFSTKNMRFEAELMFCWRIPSKRARKFYVGRDVFLSFCSICRTLAHPLSSEPSRLKDTLLSDTGQCWDTGCWDCWDTGLCWDTLVSTQRHCCLGHWLVLRHSCLDSKNCLGHWLVLAQRCRWCPSFRPEVTAHSSSVPHQLNTSLNTFNT